MTDDRELVRSRSDLVEIVGQRVTLKRVGKHYIGLCPFHDDKRPSFSVDANTGRYRCWSCGEAGDVFTWVMKTESVEFGEALQLLAQRAGVELSKRARPEEIEERELWSRAMREAQGFFANQLKLSDLARSYCEKRGISVQAIVRWEIGYAPDSGEGLAGHLKKVGLPLQTCKDLFLVDQDRSGGYFDKFRHRLTFPIYDERGVLVGFGGRALGDVQPKYLNSGETKLFKKSRTLYGLRAARESLQKNRKAILVEGYLDVIACDRGGVAGAVASLGTSLTEEHAGLLKRYADEVIVLYDSDAAGQKATEKAVDLLRRESLKVKVAQLPSGEDPDSLLRSKGADALALVVQEALSPTAFKLKRLELAMAPTDDQFWKDSVAILSESDEDLEREGHLLRLAGMYPHIRDVHVALARLTQMVTDSRRGKRPTKARTGQRASPEFLSSGEPLQAAETVLFGALLEPKFQKFAWIALKTPQLLASAPALELAKAVCDAFPESPPEGAPSGWIFRLEPDSMRRLLSDISLHFHIRNLTEELVSDSIMRLRNQAVDSEIKRSRQSSASAEERQVLMKRIRAQKPGASQALGANDDDPFA